MDFFECPLYNTRINALSLRENGAFMPLLRQFEFEEFCKSVDFQIIENGLFFGDDWEFDELRAPYNRLYIVLEGEGVMIHKGARSSIEAGYAYIVPANYSFSCHTPHSLKKLYSHFAIHRLFDRGLFDGVGEILRMKIDPEDYEPYFDALSAKDTSSYYTINGRVFVFDIQVYKYIQYRFV